MWHDLGCCGGPVPCGPAGPTRVLVIADHAQLSTHGDAWVLRQAENLLALGMAVAVAAVSDASQMADAIAKHQAEVLLLLDGDTTVLLWHELGSHLPAAVVVRDPVALSDDLLSEVGRLIVLEPDQAQPLLSNPQYGSRVRYLPCEVPAPGIEVAATPPTREQEAMALGLCVQEAIAADFE